MRNYTYLKLYTLLLCGPKSAIKPESKYVINPELFSFHHVLYMNWTVPRLDLLEPSGPFMQLGL